MNARKFSPFKVAAGLWLSPAGLPSFPSWNPRYPVLLSRLRYQRLRRKLCKSNGQSMTYRPKQCLNIWALNLKALIKRDPRISCWFRRACLNLQQPQQKLVHISSFPYFFLKCWSCAIIRDSVYCGFSVRLFEITHLWTEARRGSEVLMDLKKSLAAKNARHQRTHVTKERTSPKN